MLYHYLCSILVIDSKYVTIEMENFCELLKPHEETIVRQYIDKCIHFYGGSILWIYLSAVIIITGPVTLNQPFPTNAEYPFRVIYEQPLKMKFELLNEELRSITNIHDLIHCIRKHQRLLKYAEEVIVVVRPFALTTISLSTFALIIVGLVFITDPPLSMKMQCVGLTFSGLAEVFMYTWPAEYLIQTSGEIGQAVFDAQWYQQSIALQKYLQMIMLKAKYPLVVSIPCVMPSLSLNYYASYLSTIFSYFTTLRVVMQNE
ncbi:putative odorant receptor 85d isoform X2 [Pogonomyrmex barbatus]|uniref:Odorant receptor 85d isoform X2 n=1 Tax=Pogonomyrmex barbatus TaxID=144034 RepID=A0A6I9WE42_9HYME|nr:putative odorant receptor 85d isoform X2 [Pogonomyrmex barbatus]